MRPRFAIGRPSISLRSAVKSIGVAPLMYEPTANESTGAPASLKERSRSGGRPPEATIFTSLWPARSSRARTSRTRSAVTRPRSDGVSRRMPWSRSPRAAGAPGEAEGPRGLVLEGVDEDDPGDLGVEVAVERKGGIHGVAEDQDEGVGHRPGRIQAGEAGTGRRRRADTAADDRGVVEDVGDVGVNVPGTKREDRLRG